MGELDTDFMLNLEKARDLLPQLKVRLDTVENIPEDLDEPINQQEVDALIIFTGGIHLMARRLLQLADKMMVGSKIQVLLIEKEKEAKEEYENGARDMNDETGHPQPDF